MPAAASGKEWVRIVDTQSYFETDFNCWKDDEASVISEKRGKVARPVKNYRYTIINTIIPLIPPIIIRLSNNFL